MRVLIGIVKSLVMRNIHEWQSMAESLNHHIWNPAVTSLAGSKKRLSDAGRQPAGVKLGTIAEVGTPGWDDSGRWPVGVETKFEIIHIQEIVMAVTFD